MPAGIKYDMNATAKQPEIARYDSVYRYSGGFNLDLTNLANGSWVPPFAPLVLDFATRKARPVINVKVLEAVTAGGTSVKVAKGSLAYVGMFIGNGTNGGKVIAVDASNANYDTLTLDANPTLAAAVGDVLFEATAVGGKSASRTAKALNYSWVKVEAGATLTAVLRAYEINREKEIAPISAKDEESLGANFVFIN